MTDINGLAIAGIVVSAAAALFGLYSGHRITHAICHKRWHHQQDNDVLAYERAWGLSVACHCLSLLGTGLHVYFAVQIGANCQHDKPHKTGAFRPSCDSGMGFGLCFGWSLGPAAVCLGCLGCLSPSRPLFTMLNRRWHPRRDPSPRVWSGGAHLPWHHVHHRISPRCRCGGRLGPWQPQRRPNQHAPPRTALVPCSC